MNTRKLCGTVAAVLFTFALSAPVMADDSPYFSCPTGADDDPLNRDTVAVAIEKMATAMRCKDYTTSKGDTLVGTWTLDDPIWKWGAKGNKDPSTGCEVHYKLSKLLHVVRDGDSPARKGKGNNDAQGAANDVRNGNYEGAKERLMLADANMEYSANVNDGHEGDEAGFQHSVREAYNNCIPRLE